MPDAKPLPSVVCTSCHKPGYNLGLAGQRCGQWTGRARCTGSQSAAINNGDWAPCGFCKGTGAGSEGRCDVCQGAGWVYVRR